MTAIVMRHPITGGFATASQAQFDTLYAPRGWEIAEVDLALASSIVGVKISSLGELDPDQVQRVMAAHSPAVDPEKERAEKHTDLMRHSKEELQAALEQAGLPTDGLKNELADRIIEHEKTLDAG